LVGLPPHLVGLAEPDLGRQGSGSASRTY
jgi:hypothetical protein